MRNLSRKLAVLMMTVFALGMLPGVSLAKAVRHDYYNYVLNSTIWEKICNDTAYTYEFDLSRLCHDHDHGMSEGMDSVVDDTDKGIQCYHNFRQIKYVDFRGSDKAPASITIEDCNQPGCIEKRSIHYCQFDKVNLQIKTGSAYLSGSNTFGYGSVIDVQADGAKYYYMEGGGTLQCAGKLLTNGHTLEGNEGSEFRADIRQWPGDSTDVMIEDLSRIGNMKLDAVIILEDQPSGVYRLAGNAGGFNNELRILLEDAYYCAIRPGEKTEYDHAEFYLELTSDNVLQLNVHRHDFVYETSGASITATCKGAGKCLDGYKTKGITVTLEAPENLIWDGNGKSVTVSGYPTGKVPYSLAAKPTYIEYYTSMGEGSTDTEGNLSVEPPKDPGHYVAMMSWSGGNSHNLEALRAFTIVKISYTIGSIEGAEQTLGECTDLRIVIHRSENDDETFSKYKGVTMDGKEIPEKYITLGKGSLILTVSKEYLETLSAGNHELEMSFAEGKVSTTVKISAAQEKETDKPEPTESAEPEPIKPPKPVPQTGDNANVLLWCILILVSAAGAAMVLSRRKKDQ